MTASMPTFVLTFTVSHSVELTAGEIWPDGDAPPEPTAADVRRVVERCGGSAAVLEAWSLDRASLSPGADEGGEVVVGAIRLVVSRGRIDRRAARPGIPGASGA